MEILKQIRERIPGQSYDLSKPEIYREFCREYGEAMEAIIKKVDRLIRKSQEHVLDVVIGMDNCVG